MDIHVSVYVGFVENESSCFLALEKESDERFFCGYEKASEKIGEVPPNFDFPVCSTMLPGIFRKYGILRYQRKKLSLLHSNDSPHPSSK